MNQYRSHLYRYNQFLLQHCISLELDNENLNTLALEMINKAKEDEETWETEEERVSCLDVRRLQLRRIFSRGSLEKGGRFYGPWWQTAPKEVRKQILINGKPTVELDYSAQHIHILYDLAGADYFDYHDKDDDPYTVEGFGSENRGLMKQIFLRLTGTKNRAGLNIAMGQWVAREPEYVGYDYKRAINAFINKHQLIRKFFFDATISRKLQKIDSSISETVISGCMDKDIIVLDVHDGFIVQNKYEADLNALMVQGFKESGITSIPNITSNSL